MTSMICSGRWRSSRYKFSSRQVNIFNVNVSMKRSSVIYDSMKDLTGLLEDAGRRNSEILADDYDVFSLEESPAIKTEDYERKYSTHLSPEDALRSERRPPRLRQSRSMEVLSEFSPEKERVGLVYQGRQTLDLEEQIQSANPWQAEEKVGGIAYTLKVSVHVCGNVRLTNSPLDHCCW